MANPIRQTNSLPPEQPTSPPELPPSMAPGVEEPDSTEQSPLSLLFHDSKDEGVQQIRIEDNIVHPSSPESTSTVCQLMES